LAGFQNNSDEKRAQSNYNQTHHNKSYEMQNATPIEIALEKFADLD
jgi:hypothetical protein